MYSVNQKVSGLTHTNPNIPVLKYGRDMEDEAANDFLSAMKLKHKNPKMIQCGLFLDKVSPVIGASPDRIFYCDCCPPACVEIKCPFSINYTSPLDSSISLPYVKNGVINPKHKYFTQCMVQMGVTGLCRTYFVVWTPFNR